MPSPDVIAFGRLRDDGAIELDMLAPHARLVYPPGHPQYFEIRHHLESSGGWLVPGKDRPVGPFPDEPVPVVRARMPGGVAALVNHLPAENSGRRGAVSGVSQRRRADSSRG